MNNMNTVPEPIKHLKLRHAFKGYTPSFEECSVTTREKVFRIVDDEESKCTCISTAEDDAKCCIVYNPTADEAIVGSIDNKLIKNHKGGIADGAVFNIEHFHFVEFKTDAEGHTIDAVTYTYNKAMDQLLETLSVFANNLLKAQVDFFKETEVQCHIILSKVFPRSIASEQTYRLEFAQKTMSQLKFPVALYFDQSFEI